MFRMMQSLHIGNYKFPYVVQVELNLNRFEPVAKLRVILPKYKDFDPEKLKQGDKVIWKAGYKQYYSDSAIQFDPEDLPIEFEGKVTEVGTPSRKRTNQADKLLQKGSLGVSKSSHWIEVIAKDEMYSLNFVDMEKNYEHVPFSQVFSDIQRIGQIDEIKKAYDPASVNPSGNAMLPGVAGRSVAHLLRLLNQKSTKNCLGLDVYFRGSTLYLKDPSDQNYQEGKQIPIFIFGQNIISDELSQRPGKKVQIKIRGYDIKSGSYVIGHYPAAKPSGGSVLTFDVDEVRSVREANAKAKDVWQEVAGRGYTGSFTTFGFPRVLQSNLCIIADPDDKNRTMACVVDRVDKIYDAANATFRQKVYPGYYPEKIVHEVSTYSTPKTEKGFLGKVLAGDYSTMDAIAKLKELFNESK